MRAKIAREGREWGDPRVPRITAKPMLGSIVAVTASHPRGAVRAVFYQPSRRTGMENIYCVLTCADGRRGVGSAGGWGYHKPSAALDEAIRDAGIHLFGNPYGESYDSKYEKFKGPQSISGRGYGSMEDAMKALARCFTGARKVHLVEVW